MRNLLIAAAFALTPVVAAHAEEQKNPISVHVLSTEDGKPAAGVEVVLEKRDGSGWTEIAKAVTEKSGRISSLFPTDQTFQKGDYRVDFKTGDYYRKIGHDTFFPEITIPFTIEDTAQHYHIPLLLSPYGYTTYRGS
ncbi:hydroxyisourate hydrolase [Aureimonas glaciei]|uniref:5-hydroxyisourate hydrolase n=1 Tax=Aureimonas glaciei TaxID=1776957 RepID=A0A917DGV3_9HYPH|nr:hydroxyisourate hydrolase [Aureimonas glaciei]GGD37248.1 5-hydroxyisourate hydrolase [Aureimonas glaciei]